MSWLTMKLALLLFALSCAATVANAQRSADIRPINILELLAKNPALKEKLDANIRASKDDPATTRAATTRPAVKTLAPTTAAPKPTAAPTTTPAPQADSPPEAPAETTTPVTRGRPGRRRGNGRGNARRRPVVEDSDRFGDSAPNHRLRIVKDDAAVEEPVSPRGQISNGRRFPGAS